jgi:hypothetical protein
MLERGCKDNNVTGRFPDYGNKWCEDVEWMAEIRVPNNILNSELHNLRGNINIGRLVERLIEGDFNGDEVSIRPSP